MTNKSTAYTLATKVGAGQSDSDTAAETHAQAIIDAVHSLDFKALHQALQGFKESWEAEESDPPFKPRAESGSY